MFIFVQKWRLLINMLFITLAKSDQIRMMRTKIITQLKSDIVDLDFAGTKIDPHQTKFDPNILQWRYFSLQEKLFEPNINWPEVKLNWKRFDLKQNLNRILLTRIWSDSKLMQSEPEANDPFVRFALYAIRKRNFCILDIYIFFYKSRLKKIKSLCKMIQEIWDF